MSAKSRPMMEIDLPQSSPQSRQINVFRRALPVSPPLLKPYEFNQSHNICLIASLADLQEPRVCKSSITCRPRI